ncbi:MAG TPA: DNA polymerase III subunit gamma/tau [Burkholderiales bacterium]|nr:DNA polymerase III subunit gamma/tau [Burkholderiales bacterium]
MSQALARKWRPQTFSELVGQEHVVTALTHALEQGRLHHAYLFTGTRGVGKTTLARIIAKALNCETGVTATPCGVCAACREIDGGRFPDLVELDAASNTQVDNMRELLENALYAPTAGRYKVYLIDEVHMLSRSAFNAMLKTLEEPPAHVKFILATTDPQKVPVTVLSRCLQFNLKQIPQPQIAGQLRKVLEAEGIAFEDAALALLARAAQGSLRDALSLLDQAIAHGGGQVTDTSVRAMLGTVDQGYLFTVLEALAAGDGPAMIAEADRMAARSLSFEAALQELATLLHRVALMQAVPDAIDANDPDRPRLAEAASAFTPEEVQLLYQIALHGRGDIGLAPDEYAGFTMTLMRMLAFVPESGTVSSAGAAAKRVARPAGVAPRRERAATEAAAAATTARQPAAPAPTAESENTVAAGSGDWLTLVNDALKIGGMAKMLAQHCELVSQTADRIELRLAEAHVHLMEKPYQDKLRAALEAHYGRRMRLTITAGPATGNTPAEIGDRERAARQTQAIAAIERDPFVREMVENFDARVNEPTIKPL